MRGDGDGDGGMQSVWTRTRRWRIHARVAGDAGAPRVVLVHGQVVSSRYMAPLARALAPRHRVLAPDLPGYGLSEKPPRALSVDELADALAEYLDAASVAPAALVANSYGCQIVVALAQRHPALVARLVLVGPTVDPRMRNPFALAGRWLLDAPNEPPSLVPVMARDLRDAGLLRGVGTYANLLRDRIEDRLPLVEAPTLVVRGKQDPVVRQDWAEAVVGMLPRARLTVLEDAGHSPNFSDPQRLAAAIEPFLAERATAPRAVTPRAPSP